METFYWKYTEIFLEEPRWENFTGTESKFVIIENSLYICILFIHNQILIVMLNVKLTYHGSGNTTLVNLERYTTIYQTIDNRNGQPFTKIHFSETNFLMVEETPQEIEELMELVSNGGKQDVEWKVPTIEERIERPSFQKQRPRVPYEPRPHYSQRERSYNSFDTPNYNRY
jgi:hypothetical protein